MIRNVIICRTATAMHGGHKNQLKERFVATMHLTAAIEDSSLGGNDGKDASTMTAMMPAQQGSWHGHNNGKDTSNRDKVLGNNQSAHHKDNRADKRSGVEDMMHLQRGIQ
jgi:hypothetical protein